MCDWAGRGRDCAVASSNRALDLQGHAIATGLCRAHTVAARGGESKSLTSQSGSACGRAEELIGRLGDRKEADLIGRLRGEFGRAKSLHRFTGRAWQLGLKTTRAACHHQLIHVPKLLI